MDYIAVSFYIWGTVTLVSAIIAFLCYRWLSNVARFENRKKEIGIGMVVCVLTISSLMFLPILFYNTNLKETCNDFSSQFQIEEVISEGNITKENIFKIPFVLLFSSVLSMIDMRIIKFLLIFIPLLFSLVIILLVILILMKLRDPRKKEGSEYNRKHLFEYKEEILTKLNSK